MMWQRYELDDSVMKTTESKILLKTEKGLVEIDKGTLAVALKLADQSQGFIFHGKGKLVLDAIVETEEGAIGEPIERELDRPFLVLGDAAKLQESLAVTEKEDLEKTGYSDQKQFLEKARSLLNRFGGRERIHGCGCFGRSSDAVFAFQNEMSKLDVLVASSRKLVYKAEGLIFVADGDRTILKSPRHMIVSKPERCITHCT